MLCAFKNVPQQNTLPLIARVCSDRTQKHRSFLPGVYARGSQSVQRLLIISPVTRRAATWPLVLELKLFLSNNVRMSTATEMCTARSL